MLYLKGRREGVEMRKIFISFMPLFLMAWVYQTASAGPHISTAELKPKGSLTVGYQEEYFHSKKVQFNGENDFHGSSIFLNYAPFSSLELFLARKTLLNNNSAILSSLQSVSFTHSELGSKILLPLSQKDVVGLETAYVLLNGNNIPVFRGSGGRVRLLNTYHFSPFKLHLNTEFFYSPAKKILKGFDISRFGHDKLYGLSMRNTLKYGVGLEWVTSHVIPSIDYSLDQALGSKDKVPSFFKNPNRLTLGMAILPSVSSAWKLQGAADYSLSNKRHEGVALAPKWSFFAGLSFSPSSSAPTVEIEKTENSEEQSEEKVESISEEKVEAPKTFSYPIYPIKKSNKKIIVEKKIKKKQKKVVTPKTPSELPKSVERSIPEIPITTQDQAPVIPQTPKASPKEEAPEPYSNEALEKNYSEESENKDFLNHFR